MLAWLVWFHALPVVVRRLMGAVLILGAIALAIFAYGSHREAVGYHSGAAHVADSVNALAIKRIARAETVYVQRADSAVAKAQHTDSLVAAKPPQRLVIQTVPLPLVRDSEPKVRVIVEGVHDTVDNVPLRAAQYWSAADSVAGLAIQSATEWHAAYAAEHDARLGADSLAALWRTRALANIAPPKASHRTRDVAFATLGIVAGFVAAKRIH